MTDKPFIPIRTKSEYAIKRVLESHGFKCIHNQKLHGFYPDLLIAGSKVILEVDGKIHNLPENKISDRTRTKILKSYGYAIVRCTNYQVKHNPEKIVQKVCEAILKQARKNKG